MTIAGIIFDCDGTLVDSERLAAGLLRDVLEEHGAVLSASEVLVRFRGVKFAECMDGLCERFPFLPGGQLVQAFRERTLPLLREKLTEMPGAVAFVRDLALPMCIASNGPRSKIETSLGAVGLLDAFTDRIVSAYEVDAWKPSPVIIHHAAQRMGLDAERCLLVDDTSAGVMAGLAAGSQVAGYGEGDFSEFEGHPLFHRTHDYHQVHALLQRLENRG